MEGNISQENSPNSAETYLSELETISGVPRPARPAEHKEEVKKAIRGFRQALSPPLDLAAFAAKLKVDIRTAKSWEEDGVLPNDKKLDEFRNLLGESLKTYSPVNTKVIEDPEIGNPEIGIVRLSYLLKDPKLAKVIVCTCSQLQEGIPGSRLRNQVLSSMQEGIEFIYIFPGNCGSGSKKSGIEVKSTAAKEFENFKKTLPDEIKDKAIDIPLSWEVGLFSVGIVHLVCQSKPDPENGKPEGETAGYIFADVELANLVWQEGMGFVCLKMGRSFYTDFMKRLQEKVEAEAGRKIFN